MELKQEIVDYIESKRVPQTTGDLSDALGYSVVIIEKALDAMLAEGMLMRTKRRGYGLPRQLGCVAGQLRATASGAAFLVPVDGGDDYFIPADERSGAMHNDTVLARIRKQGSGDRRGEAEVLDVLQRTNQKFVGSYRRLLDGGVVVADDRKLGEAHVPAGAERGAWDGSKVVATITRYPDGRGGTQVEVTEVLGDKGETEAEILAIIRMLGIRDVFPPPVLAEAESKPTKIDANDITGRLDLRAETIFTIDGADAKDLDDAVSIERLPNGNFRLGVHIASVSHYVPMGGAIDTEAWERGTSVYLLNTVIPMLPERLSNGLCSLHPGEDRLTLSCIMELDGFGKLVDCELAESVIQSKARLTYDEVNAILEQNDSEAIARRADLVDDLRLLDELREILRKRRMSRGAIELDIDEPRIELDQSGVPLSVTTQYRGNAHKLIEECMLCANETVALYLEERGMPVLFRVHEVPDADRMKELAIFLRNLGYGSKGLMNDTHPMALQQVLNEVRGTMHENIIARIMLRSMKKARYSTVNLGHFGLAARHYCHFTSPIRRYPDLMVHRMIRAVLRGQDRARFDMTAEAAAAQSSSMERRAMDAERAVDDLKMTEYMADKVGQEFDAVVSGVTEFGIFVELENLIEGLVRMTELHDDYYELDKRTYSLVGRRRRNRISLGERVKVRVIKVDVQSRQIDFTLLSERPDR